MNMRVGESEHVYCCLYVCIKECGYVCVAVCTSVYTRYTSICMPVCIYPHAVGEYVWRDVHMHMRRCVHVYRCECPPELGASVRVHA